jgi:hypothetical protein
MNIDHGYFLSFLPQQKSNASLWLDVVRGDVIVVKCC